MTVYTTQHNDRACAICNCLGVRFIGHTSTVTTDDNGLMSVKLERSNGKPLSQVTVKICNVLCEAMYIADTTGYGCSHKVST